MCVSVCVCGGLWRCVLCAVCVCTPQAAARCAARQKEKPNRAVANKQTNTL